MRAEVCEPEPVPFLRAVAAGEPFCRERAGGAGGVPGAGGGAAANRAGEGAGGEDAHRVSGAGDFRGGDGAAGGAARAPVGDAAAAAPLGAAHGVRFATDLAGAFPADGPEGD